MRRAVPALALLAAAAAASVLAVGAADGWWSGGNPPAGLAAREPLIVHTSLSSRSLRFGDPLVARLDVVFDPTRVERRSIAVKAEFTPYRVVESAAQQRGDKGSVVLSFRYALECLRPACAPEAQGAEQRLPLGHVTYRTPSGAAETSTVDWPSIRLASHLSGAERAAPATQLRVDAPLPEVSYGVDPDALRGGLIGGSVLFVLAAGAILALALRRPSTPAVSEARVEPTPLERALALVRVSAANGAVDRRLALERLGRELAAGGRAELATAAARLAWSVDAPSPDAVEAFASRVERSLEPADPSQEAAGRPGER